MTALGLQPERIVFATAMHANPPPGMHACMSMNQSGTQVQVYAVCCDTTLSTAGCVVERRNPGARTARRSQSSQPEHTCLQTSLSAAPLQALWLQLNPVCGMTAFSSCKASKACCCLHVNILAVNPFVGSGTFKRALHTWARTSTDAAKAVNQNTDAFRPPY